MADEKQKAKGPRIFVPKWMQETDKLSRMQNSVIQDSWDRQESVQKVKSNESDWGLNWGRGDIDSR